MLPRHARCVLSRLRCNGHSLLLGSYLTRIGRIENSSCSACGHSSQDIPHLILHCPATDTAPLTLCPSTTSGPDLGELPSFWGSMVFRHAPIPRKGSDNQQQHACVRYFSSIYTFQIFDNQSELNDYKIGAVFRSLFFYGSGYLAVNGILHLEAILPSDICDSSTLMY